MAHMIEGNRMMYVGATPWHGLGTPLDHPPTVAEAIKAAGLDWEVHTEPHFLKDGRQVKATSTVRSSDNKILADRLGPDYQVLQNIEAFNFFDPFLAAGTAELHTAGSLFGGRRIWVLAKIKEGSLEVVKNDPVDAYILLSNSHDGSMTVRVGFTPIRVVCHNTLGAAHSNAASKLLRIRHTPGMKETLELVQDAMDVVNQEFVATVEQYRRLANSVVNPDDLRLYVRRVLGVEDTVKDEEMSTRMQNMVYDVVRLAQVGTGNQYSYGTYWAAYNGVTEFLNYGKGKNQEKRLDSLWFGPAAQTNQKALELALSMAG